MSINRGEPFNKEEWLKDIRECTSTDNLKAIIDFASTQVEVK
jgi:hypothetical protein